MAARAISERVTSPALLIRRTSLRDSDLIVGLFSEQCGAVSAVARGARRTSKRFSALEPMHLLSITVELSRGRELGTLKEASVARPRIGLTSSLAAMEAAGTALRWLRLAAPSLTPEPLLWHEINALLDALDEPDAAPGAQLAAAGIRMLAASGWALQLSACVRCSTACPQRARVMVDIAAGGVVCTRCGGGTIQLSSRDRHAIVGLERAGRLDDRAAASALRLVRLAFDAHALSR